MAQYTVSSIVLRGALTRMKIILNEQDIKRLIPITRNCLSEVEAARELRELIGLYRSKPVEVLQRKGIGKKTFESIDNLFKEVVAMETKQDTSMQGNIEAAIASMRLVKRRAPDFLTKDVDSAVTKLVSLSTKITNATMASKM